MRFRTSNTFIKIDFMLHMFSRLCSHKYIYIYIPKFLCFPPAHFSLSSSLYYHFHVYINTYIYLSAYAFITYTCCAPMLIRIELSNWRSSTTFSNHWTLILHNNIIMMKNYQRINNVSLLLPIISCFYDNVDGCEVEVKWMTADCINCFIICKKEISFIIF